MRKVWFENSRGLRLAGNLFEADSDKIVLMAHGFCGDKSMEGRFDRIGQALSEEKYNALAFDFSGCGESDDDSLTADKEVEDLQAAIAFAKSGGHEKIALYGQSLGSLICLKCASPKISTMVLVGAVTAAMHYDWTEYYSEEQLREQGQFADLVNTPLRQKVVIDRQMLRDFERIDQQKLLQRVTCPVLLVHGNSEKDAEERELLAKSRQGLQYLPAGSRLEVLEGADHRFFAHLDEVIRLTKEWLRNRELHEFR